MAKKEFDEEGYQKWKAERDKPYPYDKEASHRAGRERAEEATKALQNKKNGEFTKSDLWIHKEPRWGIKTKHRRK